MEELLTKAAAQVPALVVLVVLVIRGGKALASIASGFQAHLEGQEIRFAEALKSVGEDSHDWGNRREDRILAEAERREARLAEQLEATREVLAANTTASGRVVEVLRSYELGAQRRRPETGGA